MKNIVPAIVLATAMSCGIPGAAQADPESGIGAIETRDYDIALHELIIPAKNGDAEAQFFLGGLYFNGDGVERDPAEAIKWWLLAAEQDLGYAQFILGVTFFDGTGVPQDYTEAAKWYRRAAEQGIAQAQYNLGAMYERGVGVPLDYVEAYRLFNLAAIQNVAQAAISRDAVAARMSEADLAKAQAN